MSSPAWQFNMLSFWDKFWTTLFSPLGLRTVMGSCTAHQKLRNFAAHLSGGVQGGKFPLRSSISPHVFVCLFFIAVLGPGSASIGSGVKFHAKVTYRELP